MKKIIFISLIILFFLYAGTLSAEDNSAAKSPLSSSFSQPDFVPDISFIMDFSAVYRDMQDEEYESLGIPEFIHAHGHGEEEHGHSHAAMNAHNGFNFNYGELALYSAVDPYFELSAVFHLTTESFEIEEGFVNTTSLPAGFQLKLGKFLSGFGRLNGQHAHYWDFADQPLVYKSFFGDHGLNEKGMQLSWTAPFDSYLTLGGEALHGENASSFGYEGFENNAIEKNGGKGPNVYTGFIKSSFDAGDL
ncbi:MAG: hypothetical protein MUC95_07470, partial [Spirochaetes bacterium]|nr:hypothetical protein [Spirochaetota bacterium]